MDRRDRRPPDRRYQATPLPPVGGAGGGVEVVGPHIGPVRVTPPRVTLTIALVGSALFIIYAIIVRDESQIPMLSAGSAVLGIVFSALAVAGAVMTYQEAQAGESGRAFAFAVLGGLAALVAAGSFAVAAVLALVWRG